VQAVASPCGAARVLQARRTAGTLRPLPLIRSTLVPGLLAIALLTPGLGVPRAQAQPPAASDPGPVPGARCNFTCSPSYAETMAYLDAAAKACRHIKVASFGYSGEGRPLPLVYVYDTGTGDAPWENGPPKPVVLIIAGIHSGEICGNDALQLLLREIASGKLPEVLQHLRLLIVPIFNVDGHVRTSLYNRFTQNGPSNGTGTRRNARRLDLNRDFTKLESPECRALVRLAAQFQPDIFIDLHIDDGFERQYEMLFSATADPSLPGERRALVEGELIPQIFSSMKADGFASFFYCWPVDGLDLLQGIEAMGLPANLSSGYFERRGTISVLTEAHAYIPYERSVHATLSLLHAVLDFAVQHRIALVEAVDDDRATAIRWTQEPGAHAIALAYEVDRGAPREIEWLGKAYEVVTSLVTGRRFTRYSEQPVTYRLPFYDTLRPTLTATLPRGYLILPPWTHAVETLRAHAIDVQTLAAPFEAEVEVCRAADVRFASDVRQGHHVIEDIHWVRTTEKRTFPPGTYWVPTDQPGGIVAMHLLEADAPAGLLRWNFFDTIFERDIILEDWALEENALRLLGEPAIRAAYKAALADSAFAHDPDERLEFFYRKTPYVQPDEDLYPVFRVLGEAPAPAKP
jgi:hypothetical protein